MIMNNNLFKTLFIPAVACLLGACTESTGPDMEAGDDSLAIRFAGPAVTRAAIDDADMPFRHVGLRGHEILAPR